MQCRLLKSCANLSAHLVSLKSSNIDNDNLREKKL